MTRVDANGNSMGASRQYCMALIRQQPDGSTYQTDAYGRIMVDLPDGGYIVFFECDEPIITAKVKARLRHAGA